MVGGIVMRLERLNYNKIKIFITLDDLFDRGLSKDDIWKDSLKWHQLFHDMLLEASETFDVEINGSVAVEVFSMQAQGMVLIVTMDEQEDVFGESFIDMQVTLEGNTEILFEFQNFEHVIQLAKRLAIVGYSGGKLYSMNNYYYLFIDNVCQDAQTQIAAIMAEFGNPSFISIHLIIEYGKTIIEEQAVSKLMTHFQ